jgi:hypothetical protein
MTYDEPRPPRMGQAELDLLLASDEGRGSPLSQLASRSLLFTSSGRPTVWLLLIVSVCTFVATRELERGLVAPGTAVSLRQACPDTYAESARQQSPSPAKVLCRDDAGGSRVIEAWATDSVSNSVATSTPASAASSGSSSS